MIFSTWLGPLQGHLLGVLGLCDRLVIVHQPDVPQLAVGDVLDKNPLHVKLALPLVLRLDHHPTLVP